MLTIFTLLVLEPLLFVLNLLLVGLPEQIPLLQLPPLLPPRLLEQKLNGILIDPI
jgi:hypothetical protein